MGNPLLEESKSFKDKFDILIQLFLVKSERKWDKSDFGRETLAAKRLLKKYPDFDFFHTVPELYNKYNSFWGLQTKYWAAHLDKKWEEYNLEKNKTFKLENNPVINIELEKRKPSNVMEFLNG